MTPTFLSTAEVLELHETSIARYGGSAGIRDIGLLESALAVPQSTFGGELLHPDFPSMAGAYLYHIVQNHPFLDGNKRTGLAAARVFLLVNGIEFSPPNKELEDVVLGVADGSVDKQQLIEFMKRHCSG